MKWFWRLAVGVFVSTAAMSGFAQNVSSKGVDSRQVTLSLQPQPLQDALNQFSRQAGLKVMLYTNLTIGVTSPRIVGLRTPSAALIELLAHTGLRFEYLDSQTVAILPIDDSSTSANTRPIARLATLDADIASANAGQSNEQATLGHQASEGASTAGLDEGKSDNKKSRPAELAEVIVTAQKRSERLQDVPVPVTALSADALVKQNELRLQDYYSSVPGLSVAAADYRGDPILTIRGITTGGGGLVIPTVGVVIDDVPYGSSTGLGGGGAAIDIDPSDLARVEVLRGPQGTLYGVSSIGGLLKYVTVDPSTDAVSGRVQAGISSVYNGAEVGYNVRGAVNVPLSDTLAVRVSGHARRDPGYIDNIATGQHGVNEADVDGGHLSALWHPSEVFSLKLSALFQDIKVYGSPNVEPNLGDLKQIAVRGTGAYDKNTQTYSAILTAKLGIVDLTALSGYSASRISDSVDDSYTLGQFSQAQFGVTGFVFTDDAKTYKFTQEIRLSAPIGQRIDWLVGAFYTHENTPYLETDLAENPSTGTVAGTWASSDSFPTTYEEYAAFADLTFHFTNRFDVQIGGRESQNRQTYMETIVGVIDPVFFGAPSPVVNPEVATKDSSFTYLVTPSVKVSPDLMLYARLASGYRAGGPNSICTVFNLPCHFNPDTTKNYEIGVKGDAFDHALSFDASMYYIDWKNIQLQLTAPVSGANYYANGSRAKSQGVELSVASKPLKGITIAAWVAWNDAVLTQDFPAASTAAGGAYGVSGDRLPGSSRFSGSLSVDEEFSLASRVRGFVGGSVSYVGDREGAFIQSPQRQNLPAYANTDLRAGVKQESWTVNFFVNNCFDKRGLLGGGLGTLYPIAFNYIQPRTVGLSVTKTF